MPCSIQLEGLPGGYAISSARPGEDVLICSREFLCSSDGSLLIDRLNGFVSQILAQLTPERAFSPSQVDHLLAIIRRDKTAVVYINELNIVAEVQSKCSKSAGEPVFTSEIADVLRVRFHDIDVPREAGVLFLFSVGWQKGLFYDLAPLGPSATLREYDLEGLLAQSYSRLMFEDIHRTTEGDWQRLRAQGWFPFVSLSAHMVGRMLAYVREDWSVDDLLPQIQTDLLDGLDRMFGGWRSNPAFASHFPLLERAALRYREGDYISSTAIVYPRIEGLLRTHFSLAGKNLKPSQANLVHAATENPPITRHAFSPLLPRRLRDYLTNVYFAGFDPADPKGLSRHTVSHGVAPAQEFTAKFATVGILLLEQLAYLLRPAVQADR